MSCLKLLIQHMLGDLVKIVTVINPLKVETYDDKEEEVIPFNLGMKHKRSKGFHLGP